MAGTPYTQYVPLLKPGDRIVNPDGTATTFLINAFNALAQRTGTETENTILGVISGAQQALAAANTADAKAEAAAQQANNAVSGAGGSPGFYLTSNVASADGSVEDTGLVVTNIISFTVVGGTGPFTWSYAKLSGDTFGVTSPLADATTFSTTLGIRGSTRAAVYEVTATDATLATAKISFGVTAASLGMPPGGGGDIP